MWAGGGLGIGSRLAVSGAKVGPSHERARVELAKTGKATCRTCQRKVGEGAVRVAYGGGGKCAHLRCWKGPDDAVVTRAYFFTSDALSEEQEQSLNDWVAQHNAKIAKKHHVSVPVMEEKAVSVSSVAAAPVLEDESLEAGIGKLSNDTMCLLLSFLSDKELGRVERVSKAFLRAGNNEWKRRFNVLGTAFDAATYGTHKRAYLLGLCHGCSKLLPAEGEGRVFIKSIGRSVCRACLNTEPYTCVAKKYLSRYGLAEGDVARFKIPKEQRPNPYGRNLAPMTVFLVYDLQQAARKKAEAKSEAPAKKKAK